MRPPSSVGARACIVCRAPAPFTPHFGWRSFTLVRCARCGLVFQDPQPEEDVLATAYYHDETFTEQLFGPLRAWTLSQARHHADILDRIAPTTPGRLVDVGCSSGAWMEVAAARGWQGVGIELGAATSDAARRRGLDVRTGTLASAGAALTPASVDLITFWDVLEHVRDPNEELAVAAKLLNPQGRIAVSCPNVDGLFPRITYRLFARTTGVWEHPELPVHLYDFSPTTLARLLKRHGLSVVAAATSNTPFEHLQTTTLAPGYVGRGRKGRALQAAYDAVHRVTYPIAERTDRGNAMVVVAERSPG